MEELKERNWTIPHAHFDKGTRNFKGGPETDVEVGQIVNVRFDSKKYCRYEVTKKTDKCVQLDYLGD